jgi:hypothetical protein
MTFLLAVRIVPLVTGEWDAWRIGYGESIVQMTGRDSSISLHERKSSEKFGIMAQLPQARLEVRADVERGG